MDYLGSCLCGEIKFKALKFEKEAAHCHCSMCRKFHGAAFATFGEVKEENFKWLSGYESLSDYRAENGTVRKFCRHCGSSLIFESKASRDANIIEIALATIDQDTGLKPDAHIFLDSKVEWIEINDSLKKFGGARKI